MSMMESAEGGVGRSALGAEARNKALGGTRRRKMENRMLRHSGCRRRRGWTPQRIRTYGVLWADAAHPDTRFMRPEQMFIFLMD